MFLNESQNVSTSIETCRILRPLGFYFVFLWVSGTCLNGSLLWVFTRNKTLRSTSTNLFIIGLIFADFLGSLLEIPLPAFSLIFCRWIFAYGGCVFGAIISYFAGCSNMYMLMLISIDRYFVVTKCFPRKIMTLKRTFLLISSAYGVSILWTLMPLLGWSSYDFEGVGVSCSIKWEDRSLNVVSYNMTILTFVYLIPIGVIFMTNLKVYQIMRHRCSIAIVHSNDQILRRRYLAERRVLHTILFIIGGFLLAWTPYATVVFLRVFLHGVSLPPIMSTLPAMFAKSSVVWNPLIYVIRNRNFQRRRRKTPTRNC